MQTLPSGGKQTSSGRKCARDDARTMRMVAEATASGAAEAAGEEAEAAKASLRDAEIEEENTDKYLHRAKGRMDADWETLAKAEVAFRKDPSEGNAKRVAEAEQDVKALAFSGDGALLAAMNTASEYGFGAVIAALPGFVVVADALRGIPNPLVNVAVTVTSLAGITGSASGGMSIALAAMATQFIENAQAANIPLEVLHRVAAMASGGMDTLPHNGAVITLLAVSGLTHRQAYRDIFAITCLKTLAVFVVIAVHLVSGRFEPRRRRSGSLGWITCRPWNPAPCCSACPMPSAA